MIKKGFFDPGSVPAVVALAVLIAGIAGFGTNGYSADTSRATVVAQADAGITARPPKR